MNKISTAIVGAAALASLALGTAQLAHAQTDDETPEPGATSSASEHSDSSHGPRRGHHQRGGDEHLAELAEKLGVDAEAMHEALRQAHVEAGERPGPEASAQEREVYRRSQWVAAAQTLDLDVDEVTSALDELRAEHSAERLAKAEEALDTAVEEGELTQDEADAVIKAVEEGIAHVRAPRR